MNKFKELRQNVELTQAEVAEALKLKSASTVCMWESGERNPNTRILLKLAALYHCRVEELLSSNDKEAI